MTCEIGILNLSGKKHSKQQKTITCVRLAGLKLLSLTLSPHDA